MKRFLRVVVIICLVLLFFNSAIAWKYRNSFRDWDTDLARFMRWTEGYVTGEQKEQPGHTYSFDETKEL